MSVHTRFSRMKSLTLTEEKLSKDEEFRSSVEMKPSHDKIILDLSRHLIALFLAL